MSNSNPPTPYRVYVIELSKKVHTKNRKFREADPQFNGVLQCLYVGMTSKTPKERFEQHTGHVLSKKGTDISAAIVKEYGLYLRGSLFEHIDPMTKAEALKVEKALTLELRRKGCAVWSN